MIIGIDGNEANVEKKVGVSVYTFELLNHFQSKANKDIQFKIYLRQKPRPEMPQESKYFTYKIVTGPFMWRDVFFPLELYIHRSIDVLFSPAHYTPRFCPVPNVVTIHDVSYLYFPDEFLKKDLYKLTEWTKHALRKAKKIIAVSKSTRKDLVKEYGLESDKIEVIYNGFRRSKEKESAIHEAAFTLPKSPYILYVGTIQPRKNLERLIEAFHMLRDSYPKHKLVIVGKKGWLFGDIFDKVLSMNLEDHVIFTGYVSNKQLSSLYKKADCFAFPSLYEGFGIPLLEAMSHDCPIAASNTASLPEIGDDACVYFDPHDTIEIADTISELLKSKKLQKSLISKGKKRIKDFSWKKSAEDTLKVLKETVDENTA